MTPRKLSNLKIRELKDTFEEMLRDIKTKTPKFYEYFKDKYRISQK